MAFIGRTTATRGTLIKLRDTLEFIQNGQEILKMKRDRLAGELNGLLNKLSIRGKVEGQLIEAYEELKEAYATLGYASVASEASSIAEMKIEVNQISIMGVVVPKITVKEKPEIKLIQDMIVHGAAEKLASEIDELLILAQIEANIERIAYELMMINRKVNALEKVIIPAYVRLIRYIEDLLFDEDLEDFARIKHFRDVAGRKKT
jgi:H(+)-transporting ATP synthase subunit D